MIWEFAEDLRDLIGIRGFASQQRVLSHAKAGPLAHMHGHAQGQQQVESLEVAFKRHISRKTAYLHAAVLAV